MTVTPLPRASAPVYRSPAAVVPTRLADGRDVDTPQDELPPAAF